MTISIFNHEHILNIADALSKEPDESNYTHAVSNIADMLARDNPNFDRTNFLQLTAKPEKQKPESLGDLFK